MQMNLTLFVKKLYAFCGFVLITTLSFAQPAAPATCTAVIGAPANGTEHHITITWASSPGATSYKLEASPDNSSWSVLSSGTNITTYDHNPGDVPNSPFYYRVYAVNGSGTSAAKNAIQFPVYTACDNPKLPVLSNASNTTMDLDLKPETPKANPAITTYSIYCATNGKYVQANGTLGATEVFQTMASWGTVNLNGLSQLTNYCFYAKAKNQDGDIRSLSSDILSMQTFDASNSFVKAGSTSATNVWWSPGTTSSGTQLSWMNTNGCSGGAGTGCIGFAGAWNSYFGDFLRTPATNCTGNSSVVMTFDLSNSYIAAHVKTGYGNSDGIRFPMFIDGGYKPCTSIKINNVEVGTPDASNGLFLKFDQVRSCVNVSVTYDLSTSTNLSNVLFYLEPHCPYYDAQNYYVYMDNINIKANASACLSTASCTAAGISGHPISDNACEGGSTGFAVTTTGSVASHQWQLSTNGGTSWSNISNGGVYTGATSSQLNITGATSGMSGYQYRDSVTGSCSGALKSNVATLSISTVPSAAGNITGYTTVCQNQEDTFSIATVSGASGYTWTVPNGASIIGPSSGTTVRVNFSGSAVTGNITVTPLNACGSGTASPALTVTVNAIPATPGAITGSNTPCSNTSQTYSVTPVNGATSYTWTLPSGWSGTSSTNTITTTAGVNSGVITVKAVNSCGASVAQTLSVTVTAIPATPGTISGAEPACNGSTNTYSVVTVSGATSYTWILPNGWSGSSTTNSISATAGASGGTISVTANNTCGNSSAKTFTVTVTSAPGTAGAISGTDTACGGTSTTYSIAAVNGATSYTWTLPNGWSGSSNTNTINVTTGGFGGSSITVTANNNCGSSAAVSLPVFSKLVPSAPTVINGPVSICSGGTATYSVSPLAGADFYTWTLPNGWTGNSDTASINVLTNATGGDVLVTATNSCGTSSAQTKSIAINPLPQATLSATNSTICPGDSMPLCVQGNYTFYVWNGGKTTQCIAARGAGNYYATVTDSNNCVAESNRVTISVYPVPSVSIIVKNDTLSSYGASAYQWYYEGQPIPGATAQSYIADKAGKYAVRITSADGCNALSNAVTITLTSVSDLREEGIQVYPNPSSSGVWYLSLSSALVGSELQVYDATGRLVSETTAHNERSTIELNTAAGIYFLHVLSAGHIVAASKLVKAL